LGNEVQTISDDAFSGNQIRGTIEIPDSVTGIGDRAFADNDISGLTLGNKVQTIGADAFSRNPRKANSHNYIGGTVVIPDSVINIGARAFTNNRIKQVQFGDSASDSNSNLKEIGSSAFDGNDISKIMMSSKFMASDEYLSGQHATIDVPIDKSDVKGNQLLNVKSAIESVLRADDTTGFNLSDGLTFIDSDNRTWSYKNDTLTSPNGQESAIDIPFVFISTGSGSYGTEELIFTVKPIPEQPDHSTGMPPKGPVITKNTGTVEPPVTTNTPTQSDPKTGTVPPATTPSLPSATTGVPSIRPKLPTPVKHHTTNIVTPSIPNDTTALGRGSAAKQPRTSTATMNQGTANKGDTEQRGTTEKGHATAQTGEQAGPVAQKETINSATTTATPSRKGYQPTMTIKQPKQSNHPVTAALPQTNDDPSAKPTFIGALLLSILSWFGLARRKHEQD